MFWLHTLPFCTYLRWRSDKVCMIRRLSLVDTSRKRRVMFTITSFRELILGFRRLHFRCPLCLPLLRAGYSVGKEQLWSVRMCNCNPRLPRPINTTLTGRNPRSPQSFSKDFELSSWQFTNLTICTFTQLRIVISSQQQQIAPSIESNSWSPKV